MDARAVHPGVRAAVGRELDQTRADRVIRALEVGGGAGGAFRDWMELVGRRRRVEFTASDGDQELLGAYREEAAAWAREAGFRIAHAGAELRFERGDRTVSVRLRQIPVPDGFRGHEAGSFDLLVAQSFWDLVPPGTALPLARRLLAPGGVFYATLTFAGETRFEPAHPLDRRVLAAYHASMEGARGGDARAGARLVEEVRAPDSGFAELGAERSDWRVVPADTGYPDDEAFFLERVLGFFEEELRGTPDVMAFEREAWLSARRRQLREGRLVYTARQFDLAARRD